MVVSEEDLLKIINLLESIMRKETESNGNKYAYYFLTDNIEFRYVVALKQIALFLTARQQSIWNKEFMVKRLKHFIDTDQIDYYELERYIIGVL